MILNFDATFAKERDVVAAVVMMTAPVNLVMVKIAVKVARVRVRVAANLEKMILPPKPQKVILNFDATFAKVRDVVAAVVMMTALVNRRMSLVHQRSQKTAPVNLALVKIAVKVARVRVRVAANLEKMIL